MFLYSACPTQPKRMLVLSSFLIHPKQHFPQNLYLNLSWVSSVVGQIKQHHLSLNFLTKQSCKWTQSAVSSISDPPLQYIYHPHNNPHLPHPTLRVTTRPPTPNLTHLQAPTAPVGFIIKYIHPSGRGSTCGPEFLQGQSPEDSWPHFNTMIELESVKL